ncbi:MAG: hypothetical protein N4J56_005592 [Chroococcidiopsis sp. SAG 2025]|uniref:hypothetical protein n=1 Tax=Chroococcidiopsis sp. SAG 2025 TaxID=171389 RepID=UPI0029372F2F|nr:hypothetical protein [Chroococcidiopsis sp. SAG 2025]MDV2995938.1 hypothetical protein [Chroococcidiopsis sp. SAG 2025]
MISAGTQRFLYHSCITLFSAIAAMTLLSPSYVQAQTPPAPATPNQAQPIDPKNPNIIQPSAQNNSVLSVAGGQRLMSEASSAISSQNYDTAVKKLQEARQVFNQMSNFYQQLAGNFQGIDNRIADSQRKKALDTAQMRDDATYQLALVHRAQNKPELAVPLLVQIVNSQNPTRDLGKKAYQQLFELGFVDAPFPRTGDTGNAPQRSEAKPPEQSTPKQ